MKMLTKLQEEAVEVDYDDPYLKLDFPCATALPPPCISVTNVAFARFVRPTTPTGRDQNRRVADERIIAYDTLYVAAR